MSLVVQVGVPSIITVGDAVSFTISDASFPAGTWTSQILFRDAAGKVTKFTGTQSGLLHLFTLTNANTGTLTPGQNRVGLVFSDGTNRQSGDWAVITALPNPTADSTPSFAARQVELLRKVIARFNGSSAIEVNFNGQSFRRDSMTEYQKQLSYWESRLIAEEEQAAVNLGLPVKGRRIPVAFVSNGGGGLLTW